MTKRIFFVLAVLFVAISAGRAERLVPSQLDPAFAEAREEAFIPWSDPKESGAYWKKLSPSHVPIYCERKHGNLSRDIYIPNPGIGYWVLGGLTEEALWKTHREKLKIGDELVSASVYVDERGNRAYWALWAPKNRSYLLKDKMRELGITPARVEPTFGEQVARISETLDSYVGMMLCGVLALQALVVVLLACLLLRRRNAT